MVVVGSLLGLGMFWVIWNCLEMFILGYKGDNQHSLTVAKTDKTLKALPSFTR